MYLSVLILFLSLSWQHLFDDEPKPARRKNLLETEEKRRMMMSRLVTRSPQVRTPRELSNSSLTFPIPLTCRERDDCNICNSISTRHVTLARRQQMTFLLRVKLSPAQLSTTSVEASKSDA